MCLAFADHQPTTDHEELKTLRPLVAFQVSVEEDQELPLAALLVALAL